MYSVEYSSSKNRIYIAIKGALADSEIKSYTDETIRAIDHTQPGFTVCADLSEAAESVLENSGSFQSIRDYARLKSLSYAITILSPDFYKLHLEKPFAGVVNVCTCMEIAENILNNQNNRGY